MPHVHWGTLLVGTYLIAALAMVKLVEDAEGIQEPPDNFKSICLSKIEYQHSQ